MKKIFTVVAALAIAVGCFFSFRPTSALAAPPCAKYTIDPYNGATVWVNGVILTANREVSYNPGDSVNYSWNAGCAPWPNGQVAMLKAYVYVVNTGWVLSHTYSLVLDQNFTQAEGLLTGSVATDCSSASPGYFPIGEDPCQIIH